MFKKVISLSILSLIFFTGCDKTATMKEKIDAWKEASLFMQEHKMAGTASLYSSGDGNVYQKMAFGVDTGISVSASVQFNSTPSGMSPASQPTDLEE